jgi:hypothetical protein
MNGINCVALFCDDIRDEVNNTATIVGVMPDNLMVTAIPGALQKLALYVRCHIDVVATIDSPLHIFLQQTDGSRHLLQEIPLEFLNTQKNNTAANGLPFIGLFSRFTFSQFVIPTPGTVSVIVRIGGQETVCGVLKARQATFPSIAPSQPSQQSPADVHETKKKRARVRSSDRPASPKKPRKGPSPS